MNSFLAELKEQRWDDHRFYHRSRINQTLHLISAISFVATYVLLFTNPVIAALFGWTFAMCIRQVGHFVFEPKGYDADNHATHEYKEQVKVGYNLRRKVVLHAIWGLSPLLLVFEPSLFGLLPAHSDLKSFMENLAKLWIGLAGAALLFRTVQLFFIRGVRTGLAWFVKILTDPFHDIWLYYKAPFYLLRGQLIAPPAQHA